MSGVTVSVHDVSWDDAEGILDYRADVDGLPEVGGGEDFGRVFIRLAVDGDRAQVFTSLGQGGDLAAIAQASNVLNRLSTHLKELLDGRGRAGRCFGSGDWGRCYNSHGHDGAHKFPTEANWRALQVVEAADAT